MLIDVEEDLTVGAAGSPRHVAVQWHGSAVMIVIEVDVAAILVRAGVRVARSPSRLEFASAHHLGGGAYVKWEPC